MLPELVGFDTPRPMVLSTEGSVGEGGKNRPDDVRLVQSLLNRVPAVSGGSAAPLAVDGLSGPKTIAAIRRYQQFHFGTADGRVDARNRTIRHLVPFVSQAGTVTKSPGLAEPTADDLKIASYLFDQSAPWTRPLSVAPRAGFASPLVRSVGGPSKPTSTGFGAPFTLSGWTIDNNAFSVDASIKDTGVYVAFLEIFQDADPTQRQKLKIVGGFKSVSKGLPGKAGQFGFDIALPSFPATQGPIIRGLQGFIPLFGTSFAGVVGFNFASVQAVAGAGVTLFQFGWNPAGPPGLNVGFALVGGVQAGMIGIGAGGGTGFCVPV